MIVIISLFLIGCSTEIVEEKQTIEEQIDEAQTIVKKAMEDTKTEQIEEEKEEEQVVEEISSRTHLVQIKKTGFDPAKITIKPGDKIQWENTRSGNLNKALITGSSPCTKIKSATLMPGETFSWTFNDPVKCVFTDAIAIVQVMNVIVEE